MSPPETDRLPRWTRPQESAGTGVAAEAAAGRVGASLHISVRREAKGDVVLLAGELDIATAPQLRSAINGLLQAGRNRIVVDLDAVTFLDAAAIDAVITATSAVALSGGALRVTHDPDFMRLLQLTLETHRVDVARAMQGDSPEPRAVGLAMIDPAGDAVEARSHGTRGADALTEGGSDADLPSLLRQSAGGDQEAFAAVYDATAARAYGLGLRVLRDAAQAAEVVQEAYLYLWRNAARYRPTYGSPIAWILTVVHRCAVRRARSEAGQAALADSRLQTVTGPPDGAVVELRSPQAEAVELAYFEGYTHTQVEKMTGLPVGTAHVRIRDGLLDLPDRMGCGDALDGPHRNGTGTSGAARPTD